jgi:ParB/Sulfiredoxin domain
MTIQPALDETHASWRDIYQVHPCADVFPMMSDEEIEALATDIKVNGLRESVVLWKNPIDQQVYILDGRNRLDALERIGIDAVTSEIEIFETQEIADPAKFVISKNICRRHLTKQQQADLIVATFDAAKSTMSIMENTGNGAMANDSATSARSFSPTKGQRGGSTKDLVLQAAVEEGRKHNISKRTIQNARAKRRGLTRRPSRKLTDASQTPVTGEASAVQTSESSTTATAVSKRIAAVMHDVELVIQQAVKRWPHGSSRQPLILFLHSEADRLATGDEAMP